MKLLYDIMRCLGNDCPIRESCERFVQHDTNTNDRTPYTVGPYDHDKGECDYFYPTQGATKE